MSNTDRLLQTNITRNHECNKYLLDLQVRFLNRLVFSSPLTAPHT